MIHQFELTGLTCGGCVATVKRVLLQISGIESVDINTERNEATIKMAHHVSIDALKAALTMYPKYTIADKAVKPATPQSMDDSSTPETKSWLATYQPLLTVFAYITGIAFLAAEAQNFAFLFSMTFMRYFMAGFFLAFSFFKMLDISGFADSYSGYDILAKRWHGYGFIYPFIELALGVAYLINFQPLATNIATVVVMSFSIIGVLESVLNKRKIRCACLGVGFNLPMSTVTIVEDLSMILMAAAMLFFMA